jgi:hypothetical protein
MKMLRCRTAHRLCAVASGLLALLLLSSAGLAADVRYLWQSRDQFVALELQDSGAAGPAQPNDHPAPAALTQERLTAILASMDVRADAGSKPEPLFTAQSLQVLAPQLEQALQQATPGQDVTFASIGLYSALYGLAKSPKVTTGRVFYKAGRLNIIVGLAQQEVRDRDDRRLFPFTPGSRQKVSEGDWALLPQAGQNGYTLLRKDWVTFSDGWLAAVVPAPVAEQQVPQPPAAPARIMPAQPAPVQIVPAQPMKPGSNVSRSPADRLNTLNELRDKGLISAEEYRDKRMEILNGL